VWNSRRLGRIGAAAAGAVVLVLSLGGCRTSPGAAALVGDDRISTGTLQHEVDRALSLPQVQPQLAADRAGFTRTELSRLVNNLIIQAAADEHGITASQSDVEQQLNEFAQQAGGEAQLYDQAQQSGIPKGDLREFTRFYVLQQKLADKLVAKVPVSEEQLKAAYQQNIDQYDQVHSAHILVKSKSLADSILAQVRQDPSAFARLAAKYSIDTSNKATGGDLGFAGHGQFVPEFSDAIFAAKPGSFIEVHSQFGWHVVHVISHKRTPLANVTDELKTTVLQNQHDALLSKALTDESKRLGVHVNPRYGRWDATQGTVVAIPASSGVSSPSPTPGSGGQPSTTPIG
jgi:parvulin-like peptidyl-prolyl isomerase